ncbi:MAG: DUF2789 domain-containing protein [Proteobacteria bacterium]|nr:DUF2789 domain-containing protein [Pseudomonadota bacterium]NOG59472.1 DUF2789 domain-containing protein [Pseudomonadota bacterium]
MENFEHTMSDLFAQLGLPDADDEINNFIHQHRPIPASLPLEQAIFWNNGQSQFIHEALNEDSDWAELVDQLDTRLRA